MNELEVELYKLLREARFDADRYRAAKQPREMAYHQGRLDAFEEAIKLSREQDASTSTR
jgi:hypothetical protein